MSLSADELYTELYNQVFSQSLGDADKYRQKIGEVISKYITNNTIINGVFSGLIPGTPPVPITVNGIAKLKLIKDFNLPYGDKSGMGPWWIKWAFLLSESLIVELNEPLVGTGKITFTPLTIPKISEIDSIDKIWKPICTTIVNTVKSGTIPPIPSVLKTPSATGTFSVINIL